LVDRFFHRHTSIILKPSRPISAAWKLLVTEETLRDYYLGLGTIIRDKLVRSDYIFNLDEIGMQEGEPSNGIVGETMLTSSAERIQSDASTWISI
jgi:4-hydroxybenzoate polyprenyltransferase